MAQTDIVVRLHKLITDAEPSFPETEVGVTVEFAREIAAEIERLRAYADHFVGMEAEGHQLIIEAAALLDALADTFKALYPDGCDREADCRAMAAKLRK